MTLSAKQRRRYLLLPIPAVAAVAIGAVFASSAMAEAAALEWTLTKAPDLGAAYSLEGVEAVAADDVWAVGQKPSGGSVALHWDGKEWQDTSVPGASLSHVSSVADKDVWAVGGKGDDNALTARWDGKAWQEVPTPRPDIPDGDSAYLYGVDGAATDDVWGVGTIHSPDTFGNTAYLQHWDGSEWTLQDVPLPDGAANSFLSSVAAFAADDVWAVGYSLDSAETMSPLLLHWDGKEWSTREVSIPETIINDITVTEDGRIWLAGSTSPGSDPFSGKPMLAVGDGKTWTNLDVPAKERLFDAVTPDGTGGVIAVGFEDDAMVVRSDGTTVTREDFPVIDADFTGLSDVDLVPGTTTLWTVGMIDKYQKPIAAHTT